MINNARQQQLTKQLNRLEAQLDLSSDTKEQMRLEGEIKQCNEKLAVLKIPYLVQQAHELKRKGSYTEALGKWRIIQKIQPQHPELNYAIEILTLAKQNHQLKQKVMPQLALQVTVLSTVWRDLITDINAIKINEFKEKLSSILYLVSKELALSKEQSGFYSSLVYQHTKNWRVGARYSGILTNDVLVGSVDRKKEDDLDVFTAMLEYNPSEFSRIRLQYNNNGTQFNEEGNREDMHEVILQFNYTIGAHGAHAF